MILFCGATMISVSSKLYVLIILLSFISWANANSKIKYNNNILTIRVEFTGGVTEVMMHRDFEAEFVLEARKRDFLDFLTSLSDKLRLF